MEISKKDLVEVMKEALPGVETGNTILDGADTFIFKNGCVYSYNDNISVTVPLSSLNEECLLEGAIKAKDFYDLISRFSSETIKIIPKDGKWIIKNETARAELVLLESSIMEYIDKIKPENVEWTKIPEKLFNAFIVCLFNSNRSNLSGIYCNKNLVVSTDEIRINKFELDEELQDKFWISDNAVQELIKLQDILEEYYIGESWVYFKGKNNTIFSCKKLQDDLYPYDTIMKVIDQNSLEEEDIKGELPKELPDAINRASALSMNIESFNSIELTFKKDKIIVFSQRTSGNYKEDVKWISPIEDEKEIKILIDYSFFVNGINNSDGFYIKNKDDVAKVIFTHANGIQIVNTFEQGNE